MLIVDLEAGAESAQGGFGMARFSDRLRAPSKRKKDAISFEISTPSGSFGGWGINLWASADFTRSQVSAREISLAPDVRLEGDSVASPFLGANRYRRAAWIFQQARNWPVSILPHE
jgi:hypothetical protein